ncbi:MAG: hypothetical protein ABFD64_02320 [Armatimonadota bacterium]
MQRDTRRQERIKVIVRFMHIITCCALVVLNSGYLAASSSAISTSNNSIPSELQKYFWIGKGPDGKSDMILVASIQDRFEAPVLTAYIYNQTDKQLSKLGEIKDIPVFMLVDLRVYHDLQRKVLYAAVGQAGAAPLGDWVIEINSNGQMRTVFNALSRGIPTFSIVKGTPEIREVWEIPILMDTGWRPTKEFDGHVLVERIFHTNSRGVFELKIVRPALEDEKRLTKQQFEVIEKARQDFESRHPEPKNR